jgi:hypothetical protein
MQLLASSKQQGRHRCRGYSQRRLPCAGQQTQRHDQDLGNQVGRALFAVLARVGHDQRSQQCRHQHGGDRRMDQLAQQGRQPTGCPEQRESANARDPRAGRRIALLPSPLDADHCSAGKGCAKLQKMCRSDLAHGAHVTARI